MTLQKSFCQKKMTCHLCLGPCMYASFDQTFDNFVNSNNSDSSVNQQTFFEACANGDVVKVQEMLLDENVNPQYANNEPLEVALKKKHFNIVKILLQNEQVKRDTANLVRICIENMVQFATMIE